MRKSKSNRGTVIITFALGLLISCFCPPKILVGVLAIFVLFLGITCCRERR